MGLYLVTPPASEPTDDDYLKGHGRITGDDQDDQIARYIGAGRAYVESVLERQLINATWRLVLDRFPLTDRAIQLPRPPLWSVTHVKYYDPAGTLQTWDAANYVVDEYSEPGRVGLKASTYWPDTEDRIGAVQITYVAGYGADATAVPIDIRHAVDMMALHFFENREAVADIGANTKMIRVPLAVDDLLAPHRSGQYLYETL